MTEARPLYSERTDGPVPLVHDELPEATQEALLALVEARLGDGSLAKEFPEHCSDYGYPYATDANAFASRARGEVRGLEWPLNWNSDAPDKVIFDLLEYVSDYIEKPIPVKAQYHPHFRHYPLKFDRAAGVAAFRRDVNRLLNRGGTIFEMNESMQIIRAGSAEVRVALDALRPDTGDETLDDLIYEARRLFLSRSIEMRKRALDTLWGAFERLKSIDVPGPYKKTESIKRLMESLPDGPFKDTVDDEMKALRSIGNDFRIRHHEADRHDVPEDAYDYLFVRLSATMLVLLQYSDRLADDED